jgi:hypothetical protein
MWLPCTRKLWLTLLLASWAFAVGLHDLVLADDHHHHSGSPEPVITQAWHLDVVPAVPVPLPLIGLAILILVARMVPAVLDLKGVPQTPESLHSPPRPPNLKNLLFRGPPALALPFAKSRKSERTRAQKLDSDVLAGSLPAVACPTA